MRLIVLSLAGAACLAACAPAEEASTDTESQAAAPAGASLDTTAPTAPAPRPPVQPDGATRTDDCGATERQGWVGQTRDTIPSTPAGADWRVYETGDALIQDLRSNRLNIEINPKTKRIVSVRCF